MNGKTAAVLFSGLLFACAQTPPPQEPAAPAAPSAPAASAAAPAPASAEAPRPSPAPPPTAASEPKDHIVNIQGASCQALLRLSPEDRAAASMFYIGYQASRVHARSINVSVIPSI